MFGWKKGKEKENEKPVVPEKPTVAPMPESEPVVEPEDKGPTKLKIQFTINLMHRKEPFVLETVEPIDIRYMKTPYMDFIRWYFDRPQSENFTFRGEFGEQLIQRKLIIDYSLKPIKNIDK